MKIPKFSTVLVGLAAAVALSSAVAQDCAQETEFKCFDSGHTKQVCCNSGQYCGTLGDGKGDETPVCKDLQKAQGPRKPAAISEGSLGDSFFQGPGM
jgi:hypothetical protein